MTDAGKLKRGDKAYWWSRTGILPVTITSKEKSNGWRNWSIGIRLKDGSKTDADACRVASTPEQLLECARAERSADLDKVLATIAEHEKAIALLNA